MEKIINRYNLAAISYNFFRKANELSNATIERYLERNIDIPMLIGDKDMNTLFSAMNAPIMFPKQLCHEINTIQVYIQDPNPTDI